MLLEKYRAKRNDQPKTYYTSRDRTLSVAGHLEHHHSHATLTLEIRMPFRQVHCHLVIWILPTVVRQETDRETERQRERDGERQR